MKLTLSIPAGLLGQAKDYSKRSRRSLSILVSRYFAVLSRRRVGARRTERIASKVQQATGLARSGGAEGDVLFEALSRKYRIK